MYNILDDVQTSIKDLELLNHKRDMLCNASAKIFFEKGYERTTIQDIANAAGISVGSIYRYIGKKEDILTLLLQNAWHIINRELVPLSLAEIPPDDKLKRLFEKYCKMIHTHKYYFVVAIKENRSMDKAQRDVFKMLENTITKCFVRAIDDGVNKLVFDLAADEFFAYNLLILGQQWTMRNYHYKGMSIDEFIDKQLKIIETVLKRNELV